MSSTDAARVEGRRIADWLSWACAGSATFLVGVWCVMLVLSLGHNSPLGEADVIGATGFAFGMLAVAISTSRDVANRQGRPNSETADAIWQAWRDAAASVGIALVGGVVGLLMLLSFYATPSIHSQIIWFSDRVPIAGFIILLTLVAVFRAFEAGKAAGVADMWFRHPSANWARTIGLGIMAAYILIYGIMLVVGIFFLVLFLLSHLPKP